MGQAQGRPGGLLLEALYSLPDLAGMCLHCHTVNALSD